jgi:peptidoglycan/xylan/chitin deacetylase (PgdA/CDA1 family)
MYHQVIPGPHPAFRKYAVTPKAFAAQMRWLAIAGYTPVSLDVLLDHRKGLQPLPSKPIIITFDDGFQGCADYAVPILQARGFTAIIYLVAGFVGKRSEWVLADRGIDYPMMDWLTARRLVSAGINFGSHTMSHPHLSELSPGSCRDELLTSRRVLEDRLGREIRHLAYPHGSFNERVRAIAGETGYYSACSTRLGFSTLDDDPLALHRIFVSGQDSLPDFICRLHAVRSCGELVRGKARGGWRWLRQVGTVITS